VHDVNHADERCRAVGDRRGAAQHLDALDILEVQRGERGIERAAPRHAVHDEKKCIELTQSPKLGDGARRSGVAARCDRNAGGQRERVAQRGCPTRSEILLAEHFDRGRNVVGGLRESSGDDFDRRNARRRRLGLRLRSDDNDTEDLQRAREKYDSESQSTRHDCWRREGRGRSRASSIMNTS
jgi:hypothetical protein